MKSTSRSQGNNFSPVFDNGFGCDFCKKPCAGWVEVKLPNRDLGGYRGIEVFMVCADHMALGSPVYPDRTTTGSGLVATDVPMQELDTPSRPVNQRKKKL